jgi:hypothetical protein
MANAFIAYRQTQQLRCSTAPRLLAACHNAYASHAACTGKNDVQAMSAGWLVMYILTGFFHGFWGLVHHGLTPTHKSPHCWLFQCLLDVPGRHMAGSNAGRAGRLTSSRCSSILKQRL